jgi:hypothetical protein
MSILDVGVLDTNVVLDLHSVHDFAREYEKRHPTLGVAAIDHPEVVFRRCRARESLLLGIYLDSIDGATYSNGIEALRMLVGNVPPDDETIERHYTGLYIWFMKELLLSRWQARAVPIEPGWEKNLSRSPVLTEAERTEPTGSRADAWLVATAKRMGLPVITHEGFTATGYAPGGIARRAKVEGVQVLFPKQVYAGQFDESAAIDRFLQRFAEAAPAYLKENPSHTGAMNLMWNLVRHLLLGETDGRDVPARTSVEAQP